MLETSRRSRTGIGHLGKMVAPLNPFTPAKSSGARLPP
jgi:hypothetical protein